MTPSTKARLFACGFQEVQNFCTDSATCPRESIRVAFAIISSKGWTLNSIDIKDTFLQGKEIEKTVYVKPPEELRWPQGFTLKKCLVRRCRSDGSQFLSSGIGMGLDLSHLV